MNLLKCITLPHIFNTVSNPSHTCCKVDYVPEGERLRYTIQSDARKEILKRLIQLNHKLYAEGESKCLQKAKAEGSGDTSQQ